MGKNAKVLTVATNKGGVLKSSVTVNLAGVWATQGLKVLIIDTDNQGNVLVSFGQNPDDFDNTIYDVLLDGMPAEHTIYKAHENVDVIPANDDARFLEFDILTNKRIKEADRFLLLKKAMNHLRNEYDIILVDSPPTLSLTAANILTFVDHVIIPFQPEPYSKRSLVKMVEAINLMKLETNPQLEILGILPTLVDGRANLHSRIISECRQLALDYGWKIYDSVIPRSIRFADEVDQQNLPATISLPKHPIVKHYFELAKEIEEQWQEKAVKA
jgi:chromosome partitioning protein